MTAVLDGSILVPPMDNSKIKTWGPSSVRSSRAHSAYVFSGNVWSKTNVDKSQRTPTPSTATTATIMSDYNNGEWEWLIESVA